jgi:hypothetical protein
MVAGTEYTFQVQSRDFYENNKIALQADTVASDYVLRYDLIEETSDVDFLAVSVTGQMSDDTHAGVFITQSTLTRTGRYSINLTMKGLQVPVDVEEIVVSAASVTSALTTNITAVNASYRAGDSLAFELFPRDEFGNLRIDSSGEVFDVEISV